MKVIELIKEFVATTGSCADAIYNDQNIESKKGLQWLNENDIPEKI